MAQKELRAMGSVCLLNSPAVTPSLLLQHKLDRDKADAGRPVSAVRRDRILAIMAGPNAAQAAADAALGAAYAAYMATNSLRIPNPARVLRNKRSPTRKGSEKLRGALMNAARVAIRGAVCAECAVQQMAVRNQLLATMNDRRMPHAAGNTDLRRLNRDIEVATEAAAKKRQKRQKKKQNALKRHEEIVNDIKEIREAGQDVLRERADMEFHEQAIRHLSPFKRSQRVYASTQISKWVRGRLARGKAVRQLLEVYEKIYDERYGVHYYYDKFTGESSWTCPYFLSKEVEHFRLLSGAERQSCSRLQRWGRVIMRKRKLIRIMEACAKEDCRRRGIARRRWKLVKDRMTGLNGLTTMRLRMDLRACFHQGGEHNMRKAMRILKKRPGLASENNLFSGASALHGFCAWGCGFDRAELKWLLDRYVARPYSVVHRSHTPIHAHSHPHTPCTPVL
jgi:hypothetical protein